MPLGIQEEDIQDHQDRVEGGCATCGGREEGARGVPGKKRYREFQKVLKSTTCLEAIPMAMMVEALDGGYFEGPPKWKHEDDSHPPSAC